jgi:hypothetical protein
MAISLDNTVKKRVTNTTRKYKTPKSIRLQQNGLQQLEEFKDRLKEITQEEHCSDTKAFKILLNMTKHVNINTIKKAISDVL